MSSYAETKVELVEFVNKLKYHNLPLAIDDMSLSYHIGIHNKTLWWLIHTKKDRYRVFEIPKRGHQDHKMRSIQNPEYRLKNVQRIILSKFLVPIPLGPHIGAYVPGRSCMSTAQQHVKKGVIISMDIKNFFPAVKRAMIRRYFNYVGYPHRVSSLLADLLTFADFVPQGAPTSGAIANLVADNRFDGNILEDLKKFDPRWVYTRYSDDIDISHPESQNREQVRGIIELVKKRIQDAGFQVNDEKTKTEHRWNRQKVLGVVVNEKPNIPRYEYMRVRCLIHNCMMHGFETQLERAGKSTVPDLLSYIRGKISYFKQIDESKSEHLLTKLDAAVQMHQAEGKLNEADFGTKPEPA